MSDGIFSTTRPPEPLGLFTGNPLVCCATKRRNRPRSRTYTLMLRLRAAVNREEKFTQILQGRVVFFEKKSPSRRKIMGSPGPITRAAATRLGPTAKRGTRESFR